MGIIHRKVDLGHILRPPFIVLRLARQVAGRTPVLQMGTLNLAPFIHVPYIFDLGQFEIPDQKLPESDVSTLSAGLYE